MWMTVAQVPGAEQHEHRDEGDVREARHDDDQRGDPPPGRQAPPEHEQPDQAAEPDRAGDEVQPVEGERDPARRRLGRMTGRARDHEHGGRRGERAQRREQLGDRAVLALGAIDPERDPGREHEEREAELEVEIAAPERRGAKSGTSAPRSNAERSANSAVASRT